MGSDSLRGGRRHQPHTRSRQGALTSKRALALATLVAGCLVPAMPVAAHALARTATTPPTPIARPAAALTFSNGYADQLTCASASQCTVVAAGGPALTFNPTHKGSVVRAQPILASVEDGGLGIGCASTHSCVEADAGGNIAVFDPKHPTAKTSRFKMTGGYQATVACPSQTRCVVVNYQSAVTFDPKSPGTPTTAAFSADGNGAQATISCPTTALCAGSNGTAGALYTFSPGDPAKAKVFTVTSTPQIGSVACPSSSLCVALASPKADPAANTAVLTFNPHHPGNPAPKKITGSTLEFVTCATKTVCAAAGNNGGVLVFNPGSPGRAHLVAVPAGTDVVGIAFASAHDLVLVATNGEKATIDPSSPPKSVKLAGLSKSAAIARG